MPITVLKLAACLMLGVVLAQSWLPVGAGFLGAIILVSGAYRQRGRWLNDCSAPDAAERSAIMSIAGTLVCLGYFLVMNYQLGSGVDMHSREMRKMANELWILVAASMAAQWIAQAPDAIKDELDASIGARALSASCYFLLALQAALVLWFGLFLEPGSALRSMDLFVHLVIGSWMAAHIFHGLSCMHAYAHLRTSERKVS